MNALWLERMTSYKNSSFALETARVIIELKINQRSNLLKKYHQPTFDAVYSATSIDQLLLYEARAAKHFWSRYKKLLPVWTNFAGRKPRDKDVVNGLLDIGYHHLSNKVSNLLEEKNVTPAPALIHVAQSAKSKPLVYDLMEIFRADLIDSELLRYLRLKKKPIALVTDEHVAHFLHEINERLDRRHYLRDFKQCQTYHYYMDLQITKFIKAVNHGGVYEPLHLPSRHDSRCACKNINYVS
tara:strand:+ start:1696 stop:2418 length:723 start_codon:yes stop_codon:yes gene_type:complete